MYVPRHEKTCPGIFGQRMPSSAYASAQSDQGCLQTESLATIKYFNGEQRPYETAHVQDNVNPQILRMLESIFSLDSAH